ncbi:hypothetical protein J8I87_15885 [Paraburkholderia sp. LEh10]|uniref:hypothetical protein n=1 Tax=Paraburkholderia sp. LEh10 TaxID=2821353 RepID=UPI001AEB5BE1|nr:hypothetical protein [Paraburkholderia sp. LEh10]MBP0591169.1 hypothetical protein [Paraburkholderia sp. LEh10]
MEKWLVVAGIWMLFATCMVLFIRGAMGASRSKPAAAEVNEDEREGKQTESFRA